MAREMALAGVDRSELTPPPPPEKPRTLIGKLENLWYHYKIPILIGAGLLALAALFGYQMLTANPADYDVVVITELPLVKEEIEALEGYIAQGGEDLDGDGTVEVSVENLLPEFNAKGELADQHKLQNYLVSGEAMVFVFDKESYEGFRAITADIADEEYVFFAPLDTTASGYDAEEHYWCWKDDSRKELAVFDRLSEDMWFGVRSVEGTAGASKTRKLYEQGAQLIKNLAESAQG